MQSTLDTLIGIEGGVDLDIDRDSRDPLDRYYTPTAVTLALIHFVGLDQCGPLHILEPFAGRKLAIARELARLGHWVETTDIDAKAPVHRHGDAFEMEYAPVDAVVTNSPFETDRYHAIDAVQKFRRLSKKFAAFLLPLSFLEPCSNRDDDLVAHPPESVLVLPRVKFYQSGSGAPMTVVWAVYTPRPPLYTRTHYLTRSQLDFFRYRAELLKRGMSE